MSHTPSDNSYDHINSCCTKYIITPECKSLLNLIKQYQIELSTSTGWISPNEYSKLCDEYIECHKKYHKKYHKEYIKS